MFENRIGRPGRGEHVAIADVHADVRRVATDPEQDRVAWCRVVDLDPSATGLAVNDVLDFLALKRVRLLAGIAR